MDSHADIQASTNTELVKVQALNGELQVGDWVLSSPDDEYGCLVGQVIAIDKLGTPEHDTENDTDDVHVDFTYHEYSEERIVEIETDFSRLYGEPKEYDDLPLDDVIMAPEMLICLPGVEFDELSDILSSYKMASKLAENMLAESLRNFEEKLVVRVQENYSEFRHSLIGFGAHELIDMAHKIAATSDACEYMTFSHGYSSEELQFYMQFQNPLEVVADAWLERNSDISDLGFSMDNVYEHRNDLLTRYPLINTASEPENNGVSAVPKRRASIGERLQNGREKVSQHKNTSPANTTIKNKEL